MRINTKLVFIFLSCFILTGCSTKHETKKTEKTERFADFTYSAEITWDVATIPGGSSTSTITGVTLTIMPIKTGVFLVGLGNRMEKFAATDLPVEPKVYECNVGSCWIIWSDGKDIEKTQIKFD